MRKLIFLIFIIFYGCIATIEKKGFIETRKDVRIEFKNAGIVIGSEYISIFDREVHYIINRDEIKIIHIETK